MSHVAKEGETAPEIKKVHLIHAGHSSTQADIWMVEKEGQRCVLRDYSGSRPWLIRLLCRWATQREIKVHRMLAGVDGIPRLIQVLDSRRYLMEFIEGEPLSDLFEEPPGEEFFADLEKLLRTMHGLGVAHGDLRNKNILVGRGQKPYLIDFSTAWWGTSFWRKPLFHIYRKVDARRLARSKEKMAPSTLTEEEKRLLEKMPWYLKLGRLYRRKIYPFFRSRRHKSSDY